MKKVNWKRVLVTLLAACMVTVLIPNALPGVRADEEHTHPDDDGTEWIPVSSEPNGYGGCKLKVGGEIQSSYPYHLPAGKYYLEDNVDMTEAEQGSTLYFNTSEKTVLCLNGHTLTAKIYVSKGSDVTIYDCDGNGTVIETEKNKGCTVQINNGTLRLVNGTLKNSSTGVSGSGIGEAVSVETDGKFEMLGGAVIAPILHAVINEGTTEISGGIISTAAYAVWHKSGTLTLSGSPVLSDPEKRMADICLAEGMLITLEEFTGAPDGPYTVETTFIDESGEGQFAEGADSRDINSFSPKNPGFMVEFRDGQLWFVKHVHQWEENSWTYDDSQHWHACVGAGVCDEDNKKDKAEHTVPDEWLNDTQADQHYKKCPVCGAEFQRGDHDWQEGEVTNGTRVDTCKTCKTTRTVNLYGVSGKVTTGDGSPVIDASVELRQGAKKVGETTTDANGAYSFLNVEPGVYNVVATTGGKTMTILVTVSGSDLPGQNLVMPQGEVSSELNVSKESDISKPAPDVVVGGLQEEAVEQAGSDTSVTVSMNVTYYGTTAMTGRGNTREIFEEVKEDEVDLDYFQIDVEKEVKDSGVTSTPKKIEETNNVLTIVIPYSMGGRTNVAVHRYHNEKVEALERLWSKPSEPRDGTFWADLEHNLIYIYANKFSTYAISSTNGNNVAEKNPEPEPEAPFVPTYYTRIVESKNGKVTAGFAYSVAGGRVTLTVTPDEGYVLDSLTVTDNTGKEVEYRDNGDGTYTFTMPYGGVTVKTAFKLKPCDGGDDCPSHSYTDVDISEWYHDGVDYAIRNELMTGKAEGIFDPDGITTRAEMAGILWNLEGQPVVNYLMTFTDIHEGKWYTEAIRWAASEKIISGFDDGTFKPEDAITREQMALILCHYAEYKGYDTAKLADLTGYTDADKVSSWAADAMQWAVAEGLIGGTSSTTLSPSGDSTRAQAATITKYFCESIVK